ncbi:hypothetical protein [Micromonospora sp. RTP1Z1]|uniref:hypothetical protein n=1 Tax=Micromonospora sp. RTP1Z1 TaxID=2994043 RepID=UPI0029C87EC9|nr:hypothetical protein [Micromonospora sp. RTP1Z1]
MIRRLLQALDADRLAMVIGAWLAGQLSAPPAGTRRAIAVDGKTLRGSRTSDTVARHVLAAADQATGVVLVSTDVDGKTNEITRFAPLLDQLGDLRRGRGDRRRAALSTRPRRLPRATRRPLDPHREGQPAQPPLDLPQGHLDGSFERRDG